MSAYTFPDAWFAALSKCNGVLLSHVMRHWFAVLSVGPVRVPHIERERVPHADRDTSDVGVVFTWNRNGHYLDFTVLLDGRVEWFYNAPDNAHTGTADEATADLPPEFFEHVKAHAMKREDER